MSSPDGESRALGVSSRVRVALPDDATIHGVIVEDFADLIAMGPTSVRIDKQRSAQLRRWAIAADDGTLVFADDEHIAME